MKRLIRDFKILKKILWYLTKQFLMVDFALLGVGIFFHKFTNPDNFIISPMENTLNMLVFINVVFVLGFVVTYLVIWRKEIQESFDEIDLENKYAFINKRFNDVN